MISQDLNKTTLPDAPGVYFFLGVGKQILYIGKATSLKDRVRSYFSQNILNARGVKIHKMLEEAKSVKFIKTDSVLEALMLEASLIKKHQPIYNSKEKDDRSYNYTTLTKEDFPKVVVTRGSGMYGPFPYGGEMREALKIIRKIFPYRDKCLPAMPAHAGQAGKIRNYKPCFNAQIGLCPGVCTGRVSKKEYQKTIRHLKLFFNGQKPRLVKALEQEMKSLAREHKFEEAHQIKKQIFALGHIQDVALLKHHTTEHNDTDRTHLRIEAYDIAHISGTHVVGVMVVLKDGEISKSDYRKFKMHREINNDVASLKELLARRLAHHEWTFPDLIVIDGGLGQKHVAQEVLKKMNLNIDVVSVVKDERHKPLKILGLTDSQSLEQQMILKANAEAHRFALLFHRQVRGKSFKV